MVTIEKLDTSKISNRRRFSHLPFQFYKDNEAWVPPLLMDVETALDRKKHPFHEHSDGEFFIAVRDGKDVGRVAVFENKPYNKFHDQKRAQFHLLECENNLETATALFDRVYEWARERNLVEIVGPKGMGPLDGYGLLVEGFEHRQMMTMMSYNLPYLPHLLEALGFEKEVDFVSCYADAVSFAVPDRIHSIAERVQSRGTLTVKRFANKAELRRWAPRIAKVYNQTFINNWEYYPLSENEVIFFLDNIMTVADHRLIKIIMHENDIVGFLFAFPDFSAALQRSRGRLLPLGLVDVLIEMRRSKWVAVNGAGILPEYQGRGGNALLYSEMDKSIREFGFKYLEMVQIAETAVQMRNDLINLGGIPYKNHRVYRKRL